jgi:hypothetical protein
MLDDLEIEIRDLTEIIRNHLRDGVTHEHGADINALGQALQSYGHCRNRFAEMSRNTQIVMLRANIMYYSCLDHLDQVPRELGWEIITMGGLLKQTIEADVEAVCRLGGAADVEDVRLLKHKLAYLVEYINELYRIDNLKESLEFGRKLYEFARRLRESDLPLSGLYARICFHVAKPLRQLMRYDEARRFYDEALVATYRQAEEKMNLLKTDPEQQIREFRYYRRRAVTILAAGSGFINIACGNLQRAAIEVWPLRTMMILDEDILTKTYLMMLTASIIRARAGTDKSMLVAARDDLTYACEVFKKANHHRYLRPTLYELVLTLIYLDEFERAEELTNELRALSPQNLRITNQPRWGVISYILDGIRYKYQGLADKSLAASDEALKRASRLGSAQKRSQIEGQILRGEALFNQDKFDLATAAFNEAIRINQNKQSNSVSAIPDRHLLTVAEIYLARIALRRGENVDAHKLYRRAIAQPMEHRWVINLIEEYECERKTIGKSLIIDSAQRPYKEIINELEEWIIRRLVNDDIGSIAKIAKITGMRRAKISELVKRHIGPVTRSNKKL